MNAKRYPCVGIDLVHMLHDSTTTALRRYKYKNARQCVVHGQDFSLLLYARRLVVRSLLS
jgi:hypothetical protein